MAKSKRGLGKGLDALIGKSAPASAMPTTSGAASSPQSAEVLQDLPMEKIQRGQYQPRRHFEQDALEDLALSIKKQGLLQPIVVRPISDDKYEIIAGERRWRASQIAGLSEITAIIKQIDDESAIAMALIENIQREDLNPVEEALALQRLQKEFDLSQQEVADAVGKPRSTVANILRLTALHPNVLSYLERGDIETGHAKCLLSADRDQQPSLAKKVIDGGLTVRQLEQLMKAPAKSPKPIATPNADIMRLETDLAEKLGAKVSLQQSTNNKKGKLVIHYNNLDELDGILKHIH
ncbi:MAG: ParB/RepB/Spo0J family partition protein [Pseudomonadota bacterium]